MRVVNITRNTVLAEAADVAGTSAARRRGLLARDELALGEGLWIVPCEAVHTIGMRFAIDIVFINRKRKVLKVRHAVPRWRFAGCLRAHSVLELPAGVCDATRTARGDELQLEPVP